jgi:hypothetical protein
VGLRGGGSCFLGEPPENCTCDICRFDASILAALQESMKEADE